MTNKLIDVIKVRAVNESELLTRELVTVEGDGFAEGEGADYSTGKRKIN